MTVKFSKAPLIFLTMLFVALTVLRISIVKTVESEKVVVHQAGEKSTIGEWNGIDLGQSEIVAQILGTNDLRYREFSSKNFDKKLYYFEMNSPLNSSATHPPEISLISDGYEVSKSETVKLKNASGEWNAKRVYLKGPKNDLLVYYWFGVNDYKTESYLGHQLHSFLQMLTGHSIRSTTRKVSVELPSNDIKTADSDRAIQDFVYQYR